MNCDIIKDLIPLYIDSCCSEESQKAVREHICNCSQCRKLLEDMKAPADIVTVSETPKIFRKLNDWKASLLQSVLLFLSFALITVGVALEARTPSGIGNGFWALNLVIPATGFMLSLANWYFIRVYQNKRIFSNCSLLATAVITVCGYVWAGFHYEVNDTLFAGNSGFEVLGALLTASGIGATLTAVFCVLSKILSAQYAKFLGKE